MRPLQCTLQQDWKTSHILRMGTSCLTLYSNKDSIEPHVQENVYAAGINVGKTAINMTVQTQCLTISSCNQQQ